MKHVTVTGLLLAAFIVGWAIGQHGRPCSTALAAEAASPATPAQIEQLRVQVKQLEGLVPDQAAVMTKVGYHFTNLYIALQHDNWPLADFYLGETRNNVKWAVRAKPIRKNSAGQEIDLAGIAQAVDNGPFTDLKKAIDAKKKEACEKIYAEALTNCYACHKASSKPYL